MPHLAWAWTSFSMLSLSTSGAWQLTTQSLIVSSRSVVLQGGEGEGRAVGLSVKIMPLISNLGCFGWFWSSNIVTFGISCHKYLEFNLEHSLNKIQPETLKELQLVATPSFVLQPLYYHSKHLQLLHVKKVRGDDCPHRGEGEVHPLSWWVR